jgi:choline monooxygenase
MIDKDITKARTMPASFYHDIHPFTSFKESLFRNSWHYLHGNDKDWDTANVIPLTILPDYLDEPVILSRDKDGKLRCFSNVCTHRGNLLVSEVTKSQLIRCRYHGRCFGLDGQCKSQRGMEVLPDFPNQEDHLQALDVVAVGPMQFGRIRRNPDFDFSMQLVLDRMSWFPFQDLKLIASKEYLINAHWALYVDNYLEGYHVPFVHPDLNKALDPKGYEYHLFPGGALQIGRARGTETAVFAIPDHA